MAQEVSVTEQSIRVNQGDRLDDCIARAIKIARLYQTLCRFVFNGIKLVVGHDSDPAVIRAAYYEAYGNSQTIGPR